MKNKQRQIRNKGFGLLYGIDWNDNKRYKKTKQKQKWENELILKQKKKDMYNGNIDQKCDFELPALPHKTQGQKCYNL